MTRGATTEVPDNPAEIYEKVAVPAIFQEWSFWVVDQLALSPGEAVLDVACGTGVVARECLTKVGPAGKVVGLDLSDDMLAVARRLHPEIEWRQGDAATLPFGDTAFDAVVCQFGLTSFSDRVAALQEMWRVLAPGGKLMVTVWWGSIDDVPAYAALAKLAERHRGPDASDAIKTIFTLASSDELTGMFRTAGMDEVRISTRYGTERFASLETFVAVLVKGYPPLAALFDEPGYLALLEEAKSELAFGCTDDGRFEIESPAHVITVRKL